MQLFALVNFVHALWKAYDSRRKEKKKNFLTSDSVFQIKKCKNGAEETERPSKHLGGPGKGELGISALVFAPVGTNHTQKPVTLQEATTQSYLPSQTNRPY